MTGCPYHGILHATNRLMCNGRNVSPVQQDYPRVRSVCLLYERVTIGCDVPQQVGLPPPTEQTTDSSSRSSEGAGAGSVPRSAHSDALPFPKWRRSGSRRPGRRGATRERSPLLMRTKITVDFPFLCQRLCPERGAGYSLSAAEVDISCRCVVQVTAQAVLSQLIH